jgi:hypothetical protein
VHAEKQHAREPGDLSAPWSDDQGRSAKATSRTADVHVLEKSNCAVVPVNQPNKEGQPSAEAGEGRAQTKENIAIAEAKRARDRGDYAIGAVITQLIGNREVVIASAGNRVKTSGSSIKHVELETLKYVSSGYGRYPHLSRITATALGI